MARPGRAVQSPRGLREAGRGYRRRMPTFDLPDLPSDLLGVAIRTVVIYLFLLVVLRLAGKRELGQLSVLDLVLVLVIANAAQNAMVGSNVTIWAAWWPWSPS